MVSMVHLREVGLSYLRLSRIATHQLGRASNLDAKAGHRTLSTRPILSFKTSKNHNSLIDDSKTHRATVYYNMRHPLTTSSIKLEDYLDIQVQESEDGTYIEALPKPTGRQSKLIKVPSKACALCSLNLTKLDYTDVMILQQFIKADGSLSTLHESQLCAKQYYRVKNLIEKAQRCNLIKRPSDYLVPGPWHDLNTYLEPDRRRDQPMKIIKKEYWKI